VVDVERVDFINIASRDPERSRAWYREMLGLELDPNNPAELTVGQTTLAFWNPEEEGYDFSRNIGGFAVRVADVEQARDELIAKGAECVGSGDTGACNMAVFLDPDGNAVLLHRRYRPYDQS
jgi:catechol 2,3-dioxygenase-like lactoylglutathione lyase family enzyme